MLVTAPNAPLPVSASGRPDVAAPPGALDTSFHADGLVITEVGTYETSYSHGNAVAVQSDGKIIVAGTATVGYLSNGTGNADFMVVRYNPDGSLDTSFDTDGKLTTDFAASSDSANDLALQPDGKIVVAGYSSPVNEGRERDCALARYNSDGSPVLQNTILWGEHCPNRPAN